MNKWLIIINGSYNVFCEFGFVLQSILIRLGYDTNIKFINPTDLIIDGEDKNIVLIRGMKGHKNNSKIKFINCKYKIFYQLNKIFAKRWNFIVLNKVSSVWK